jgi:YD repeat-containing protein
MLCMVSCGKDEHIEEGRSIRLTKITTGSAVLSYTYDASGKLSMEQYAGGDDSYKTTYNNYGSKGELLGFTITYENDQETDLRCENEYDEAGRLVKMNRYDLITGVLVSYCTIEYGDDIIIRKQYNPPATLWATDEYILTADKKNIAKYLFYSKGSATPTSSVTYGEYDDKINPRTLLPSGYSPERMVLSQNNPLSAVWVTESMPPDAEISYIYTYQYNNDGCPVKFSTASELYNSSVFYEYNIN